MARRALLITNPRAGLVGRSRGEDPASSAVGRLVASGLHCEVHRTLAPGDATLAAARARGVFDLVVAGGGDGTVHEVANGLAGSETPMGILPLGTMNILAREIGMPLDVEGACRWLAGAEPAPITLGLREDAGSGAAPGAAGRWFAIVAGIGFDAYANALAARRAARARRKVRLLDYWIAGVHCGIGAYDFPPLVAEIPGSDPEEGAFAFVANCARYGGNLRIARRAVLEEPCLDLVLFRSGAFRQLLRYFTAVALGRVERTDGVLYRKVQEVRLRPANPGVIHCELDGEAVAPLPAAFRAVPRALRLLRMPGAR